MFVQGDSNRGPQAKPYVVNFNITNSQLNGDKFPQGHFLMNIDEIVIRLVEPKREDYLDYLRF